MFVFFINVFVCYMHIPCEVSIVGVHCFSFSTFVLVGRFLVEFGVGLVMKGRLNMPA